MFLHNKIASFYQPRTTHPEQLFQYIVRREYQII